MNNADSPANPWQVFNEDQEPVEYLGLTKREHFAGLAMKGLISTSRYTSEQVTEQAVKYADELLQELDK